MQTSSLCVMLTSMLLASCSHAPCVCSRPSEPPARVPVEANFLDRTQSFLRGKLPEQTTTPENSSPAKTESGKRTAN